MIKGIEIELGGEKRIVPPLNFNQVEALEDDITSLSGGVTMKEQMRISRRIAHAAISRNYPEVTVEQVGEWLDLSNAFAVVGAVLGNSGFAAGSGGSEGGEAKK